MDINQANQQLMQLRDRNSRELAAQSPRPERPSSLASPDELTWPCPFCGAPVLPMVYEVLGKIRAIRRQWCVCEAAQIAKCQHEAKTSQAELEGRAIQFLMRCGIHIGKYPKMTFEAWDIDRHPKAGQEIEAVISFTEEVKHEGPNLCFLYGGYGTGKTHLAVAALRKITYDHIDDDGQGWKPYMVDWAEHCSTVQQSWEKNDSEASLSEGQLWGMMKAADILMIDDIDKGRPTEWALGKLYEVVQRRYMQEKPTLVTGNHSIETLQTLWAHKSRPEFVRDLGGAILSRFSGQLWGQIEFTGPDQRDI